MLWASIGGHPRTLEMLDALLGHGRGRLVRIERDLKRRLKRTLPDGMDVDSWLDRPRDLDVSVAETVTLAANDVLLPQLLALLSPEAKRLLRGLALFRRPVERPAAIFVLGTPVERDTTANETNDAPDPPFTTDLPVDDLLDELVSTTLLPRLQSADGSSPRWFVHRWTPPPWNARRSRRQRPPRRTRQSVIGAQPPTGCGTTRQRPRAGRRMSTT